MRNWLRRREDKAWKEGFDNGWDSARYTTEFLIRKRFERLELEAEITPNLYSLEDILKVVSGE
jgi:hypothetical protein